MRRPPRLLFAVLLVTALIPLLVTCTPFPTIVAPVAQPPIAHDLDAPNTTLTDLPGAAPLATAGVLARPTMPPGSVTPAAMPAISRANVTPTATTPPLPTPAPAAPTVTMQPAGPGGLPFPIRSGRLEFGAHAHLFWTDRSTPLVRASDGGFTWIRQQIHWRDQEGPPGNYAWGQELDEIVAAVNARGLRLMISIVRSPPFYGRNGRDGLPEDPNTLGNFVAALASRYQGRVHAIQIWNEQNLAYENGGYVSTEDAGRYVEILKVAYTRIKEVDPTILVITGAPASTAVDAPGVAISDERYYSAMFAYQDGVIRNYMDALGMHPGGSANPPESYPGDVASPAQGWTEHPTFYFRRIEDIRALMLEYGMETTPVWITEFGWATPNSTPGFEFGNQVSLDLQAQYIERAMRLVSERYPWVDAMFVWNLNFAALKARDGDPMHEQASFSILDGSNNPRPAFWAAQVFIRDLRASGR
jgi:polysaccharide biosynthesis protein PslG